MRAPAHGARAARRALAALAALAACAACGGGSGDPTCGDGEVGGAEQCDDGNAVNNDQCDNFCRRVAPPPDTVLSVTWTVNGAAAPGFNNDACSDVGATQLVVDLAGPTPKAQTLSCSDSNVRYTDVLPGTYHLIARLLDGGGADLATAVELDLTVAANLDNEAMVDFPFDTFAAPRTGALYFRTSWGGADCTSASPPVTTQRLSLFDAAGALVATQTDNGTPLDASGLGACRPANETMAQTAVDLPWGPYDLAVEGLDGAGAIAFCRRQAIFVGAGDFNPEFRIDGLPIALAAPCP